nr:MAG TPA: hypothetical protein [Caudoviricetes sp.]
MHQWCHRRHRITGSKVFCNLSWENLLFYHYNLFQVISQ